MREIKIHLFVNHPNIARLYGCFHDPHFIYLICELATDNNLYETLSLNKSQGQKGLPAEAVAGFVGQISRALAYMHAHSIIHRDVKPENMLVTFVTPAPRRTKPSSCATSGGRSTTPRGR